MLIDVTVNVPPRPDMSLALDGLEALGDGADDGDDAPLPPEKRPVTITWCPTCSARLTAESAISFSSLTPPGARPPAPAMVPDGAPPAGGVLEGGALDGGAASPLGALDVLDGLPDAPPNFTFFSTKLPPDALLELALDGLLADVSLLDEPAARCRQPVALLLPGVAPGACGSGVVGLCAARVPHSATAVPSVTAHRHSCLFFITSLLPVRVRPAVHPGRPWGTPLVRTRPHGFALQGTSHGDLVACSLLAPVMAASVRDAGRRRQMMATPVSATTTHDEHVDADVKRIEDEIAIVRDDLGRTVAELGTRLTPAHLLEHAKSTIKDVTAEGTRAVAQSAGDMASDIAQRTRHVAADVTDRVRAHPGGAAAAGAGLVFGVWAVRLARWRSQRSPLYRHDQRANATPGQLTAAAAAVAVAWWVWKGGRF